MMALPNRSRYPEIALVTRPPTPFDAGADEYRILINFLLSTLSFQNCKRSALSFQR
jgi:hypothetical protein